MPSVYAKQFVDRLPIRRCPDQPESIVTERSGPEPAQSDTWSQWLLEIRNGGDEAYEATMRVELQEIADRILDRAELAPGMSMCDVGTGDGLVAFRALDRIGPSLSVTFSDISAPLLRHTRGLAAQRGVLDQCHFIECPADRLAVPDASVDAVTTRAVLAYVADKKTALSEFYRVLKPGGRISLFEPILQDEALTACALKRLSEDPVTRDKDPFLPLLHRWKAAQFPDTPEKLQASPIANFSERTLFETIRTTGFSHLHVEFHMDIRPTIVPSWQVFVDSSPHPWAPTLSTILAEQFSASERDLFERTMRPLVESGQALMVNRSAFFTATKPVM